MFIFWVVTPFGRWVSTWNYNLEDQHGHLLRLENLISLAFVSCEFQVEMCVPQNDSGRPVTEETFADV
jgi:hypothetical protein